jgi:RNA polymerase sigma factor (sigma-70 family)
MSDQVSDATLLDRFVRCREEAAFATLVRRHGPLVRAVCRRILASEHDAEDVVQATFLVLASRAGEIAWRESVGGWLCGVARRLSLHARAGALRRRRHETPVTALVGGGTGRDSNPFLEPFDPLPEPHTEIARRDLCRVVDQELTRLPEKYRDPVVLCDMEGMTHEEAARRLGLPAGSMSRRLGRARAILRQRLVGRGLPVAIGLLFVVSLGLSLVLGSRALNQWRRGAVREAMSPFRLAYARGGGSELQGLLARTEKAETPESIRGELLTVARDSVQLAGQVWPLGPVLRRQEWHDYSAIVNTSAETLTMAAREDDLASIQIAVRRLNGACLRCHLVFRQ